MARRPGGSWRRWPCALLVLLLCGCARLLPYRTPSNIAVWQDTRPPTRSLAEKAEAYQSRLEAWHQMADGMIRYRFQPAMQGREDRGNHADGSYFLGIYLASQALRYATTGAPEAKRQLELTLAAARLYAEVSGTRGLLARYFSPERPDDPRWRPSPTHPGYFWRSDVSKDQYAGFVHGLGVTLALVDEAEVRAEVAELAAAIADHLIENQLQIVDWDGERTTHGNLRERVFGIPIGVNALIALAIAKTAAEATDAPRYREFHARLVREGYPRTARWARFGPIGKRVNQNMAYLALYPLLLLEDDPEVAATLRDGARRTWRQVRGEHNAFFALLHAAVVGARLDEIEPSADSTAVAREEGRRALLEFPERKIGYPVDLTREGFDFPRAWLKTSGGLPRSRRVVPLHLRPMGSSLWVADPYRLAGRLHDSTRTEFAGIDYLIAYWIGRYHGLLGADE